MSDNSFESEKTVAAFADSDSNDSVLIQEDPRPDKKKKTILIVTIIISVLLIAGTVIAIILLLGGSSPVEKEIEEAKQAFLPPAKVVSIDSTKDDPSNEEITFSYDSQSRIISCSYIANGKSYNQEYSYDDTDNTVTIVTKYKSTIVSEKVIDLSFLPLTGMFIAVDDYYVKSSKKADNNTAAKQDNDQNDISPTEKPTIASTEKPTDTEDILESGIWVLYSPQSSTFYTYTFDSGIAVREQYSYNSDGASKADWLLYSKPYCPYTVDGTTLTITEQYSSEDDRDWVYTYSEQTDRLERDFVNILPDGTEIPTTEKIYHYDSFPTLDEIQNDAYVKIN